MKQTIDLMHYGLNGQPDTTATIGSSHCHFHSHHHYFSAHSLLRRVFLLLTLLAGWGNVAVAQDVATLWVGSTTDQITLSGETLFNGLSSIEDKSKAYLNIYTNDDGLSVFYADWGNNTGLQSGATSILQGQYYISSLSCYSVPFSEFKNDFVNRANQWTAPFFIQNNVSPITKITYYVEPEEADAFINEPASSFDQTNNGGEQIARDVASTTINLSGASLTGVKYVRIYLADASGSTVDPTGLLSVSYSGTAATAAGTNVKNGVYVYDGGNDLALSNVSVTLNAGAGNFTNYQIVCLLSNNISTATPSDGTTPLTQEPKWQEEYTYSFTYPIEVVSEMIDVSLLTGTSLEFNVHNDVLNRFGKQSDCSNMYQSWYGGWYVLDATGVRQSISFGNSQGNGVWNIQMGNNGSWFEGNSNGCSIANNCASASSVTANQQWQCQQLMGFLKVYAPSGSVNLSDFVGYKFVYECTDEYTSGTAVPKLKYIFTIPSTVQFEYDGTIGSSTPVTQDLASRSATSVTLDWATMTTTGVKYARFFVVDSNGDPVDATQATHLLTVNGGTLCDNTASGYYVYNGDNDITMPTVTLSSTGNLLDYKVKCWLATATTNIEVDGNTVTEEPDITNEYIYSFTKPAPTTAEKTGTIAWGASMQADATDGAPADWDTTWDALSHEQRVVWYVTEGTTKQSLALGTVAQSGTWVLNLPTGVFSVTSNEAVLTGQTTFTASEWNIWGKPAIYAPTGMAYADVQGFQVVCEVYETAAGTTPNVRYTFTFTKDFLGTLKSGVTATTLTETLSNATDITCTLSNVTIPSGTKYVRFYLTDGSDQPVDPTGMLSVTDGIAVSGHADYGYYLYNESGIASAPTVTLTLTDATLNQYKVVMVTSADNAVTESGAVINEPDYDTQTTWCFKYPVQHTEATADAEWSPASMTVALDIDALKGSGYQAGLGSNYHVVWTVEDGGGTAQTLTTGTSRQSGTWTYSVDGDNATFYAPSDATFADVQGLRFVARLYETATGENDADKSLTYTVSIVRTQFLGTLKDSGTTGSETVTLDDVNATSVNVPLSHATLNGAKYARVWLTQNSTMVDPDGKLSLPTDMTAFGTNHDATYGYYLYNADGITLTDVTLSAPGSYSDYQVHVALSVDAPVSYPDFARDIVLRRAPADAFEPDYDYEYTISFQDNSMKVIKIYVQASDGTDHGNDYSANLQTQIQNAFNEIGETLTAANAFARWDLKTVDGTYINPQSYNTESGRVRFLFPGIEEWQSGNLIANNHQYIFGLGTLPNMLSPSVSFGNGVYQLGSVLECWVTNDVDTPTAADPDGGYKVKVEVIFNEDGQPPYNFLNETPSAAVHHQMVNISTLESPNPTFDMSSALVSGAKYARFYLSHYGSAAAASNTLSVSYDGTLAIACADPYERYGCYLSDANGIDLDKLTVSASVTPDELMQYQLVVVSSTEPLGPTAEQEPAWEQKTVYSFQKEIKERIYADDRNYLDAINKQADILSRLGAASVADFSKSLYAKWYLVNPANTEQVIASGNQSNDYKWYFEIINSSIGNWQVVNDNKQLVIYTDMDENCTSAKIEGDQWNTGVWDGQIALTQKIHVSQTQTPPTATSMDYVGWKVIFEISDEYDDTATNGTVPDYRLRYVFTISDPNAFTGDANVNAAEEEYTQTVDPRGSESVTIDLSQPRAHTKLSGRDLKYARFYLTDAQGNMIDPDGKLNVTYGGDNAGVTTCNVAEHGFYIYPGADGVIDQSLITVTLTAPNAYRLYKVVGVFSTAMDGAEPADGTTPLMREPDYDLKYTYNFKYPTPTTKVIEITVPWSKTGMRLDATTTDPETDWGISFEELAAGQEVKWYVERVQQNPGPLGGTTITRQQLQSGSDRVRNIWVIKTASAYDVNESTDEATLTGRTDFTEANWNSVWSTPTIYAPLTGQQGSNANNYNNLQDRRFICEVYTDDEDTPYVRYIFTMEKFLGDLKDEGAEGSETILLDRETTSYDVPLDNIYEALNIPANEKIVYARVWLTTSDGTPVIPNGLSWTQMYDGHNQAQVLPGNREVYGWYFCSSDIGEHHVGMTHNQLASGDNSCTLSLPAGTYSQYQVHVALSTDNPTGMRWNETTNRWEYANGNVGAGTNVLQGQPAEPDFDYEYTIKFDYGFEAKNINTVKTKYKTAIYNETTRMFTPTLFQNWLEVAADCDVDRQGLADNGYARWYLEDLEGNRIQIEELTSQQPYASLDNPYGYYRYKFDVDRFSDPRGLTDNGYNPTILLPDGYDYDKVRLICVVTTKTEPQDEPNQHLPKDIPAMEPRELQVKYVYSLVKESDFTDRPFIHYQGEAYKYLMQMGKTDEAAERDYIIVDGTAGATELSWDYENSKVSDQTFGNIRQNVHTVDYYVYFDPADAQNKTLMLPSQYYFGEGNDTEPRAYYRWYDYNTDMTAGCLYAHGSALHETSDHRGYIAMLLNSYTDAQPCDANIGVRFNAPNGWNANSEEILVACDVSRYLDGMDDSFTYLMHEPTLSVRYLFHILPAQKIATDIADAAADLTGGTATGLAAVEANLLANEDTELYEYNGRTVVSLNGTTGAFTMRSDLQQLSSYWIWADETTLVNCTQLQWYAYYLDEDGKLWKHAVPMGDRLHERLGRYELSDLSGSYTEVGGSGATQEKTIRPGDRLYMIGCMGNGSVEAPVVWDEFNFIDARPLLIGTEGTVTERTDQYMRNEHTLAQILDFNDFFDENERFNKPTASYENYAKVPIIWPDAQYGFCYPQLYGLCGTNKYAGWGVYGISPTHGDYTLLKSMNMPGVSQDEEFSSQSIGSQWWWNEPLYDVTHTRAANGNVATDANDYGTFLYVDASDEARVIAELEFDAALCADAEIYYTAYVADMTNNVTRPQVRFRVSTEVDGKRVPVVTFETGDIVSEGATTGFWHQVYGYTELPDRLHNILNGATRHYHVSVENSCENTNGADYCVDQISFYTHQASVKAKIVSDICDEGDVKVKIVAEAEQLLKSLRALSPSLADSKDVFYCIVERSADLDHELHAEDILTGNGFYTDQSGNNYNNEYGVVSVPLHLDLLTHATELHDGTKANSGFYYDADMGVVYFQFDEREFHLEPGKKYFVSIYDMEENRVGGLTGWGTPYSGNACSVYSNDISNNRMFLDLSINGQSTDGHIEFGCNATTVTKKYDIAINYPTGDGFDKYTFFRYDFFALAEGKTKADFLAIKDENNIYLSDAIETFREWMRYDQAGRPESEKDYAVPGTVYDELPQPPTDDENYELHMAMYTLIKKYMDGEGEEGTLYFSASSSIERTFTDPGVYKYLAIPLTKEIPTGGEICSPLEFEFDVDASYGGPVIELGFDDVDYPEDYTRTVRVGLEQLSKMTTKTETVSNYMLHIPISRYSNKGNGFGNRLYFEHLELNLVATNDPTIATDGNGNPTQTIKVAEIKVPEHIGSGRAYVGPDRMFLPVDFSPCEITFHEGYWYEVSTTFVDEEDDGAADPCRGDLFFTIKVVPEFATWQSTEIMSHDSGVDTPTGFFNANWYQDANWQRSVRADLYKDAVGGQQNTVTLGHSAGYNDDLEIDERMMGNPGFVPMKFTYVTILSGNHAPSLIKEPKVSTSLAQQGGGLLDPNLTRMLTDPSPYTNQISSEPTENIRYDMLVRYGAHSEGGEGCFGHRQMSMNQSGKYVWGNDPRSEEQMTQFNTDRKAFDVEKFYGNICKEIYFKPGAELLRQQRLRYNRAWVEKELVPNKWYLVGSPLKDTYAGDMYVPTVMTNVATNEEDVPGQQLTEAFQPINFNTDAVQATATATSQPAYSRTKYPIYQRSWNTTGSRVYTKTNDARATDYSANLVYSSVSEQLLEWSHTYNDVKVPYSTLTGFSIRADRKQHVKTDGDNQVDVPALIRLPKADSQYDYYQWDNTSPADGKLTHDVARTVTPQSSYPLPSRYNNGITDNYRFVVDDPEADGLLTVDLCDLQQQDGYILVGNPFMASLRMDEFFKGNQGLAPNYWTYNASTASTALVVPEIITATGNDNADGIIRPLQAFFVKKKTELDEGETETTAIVFTRNMTIDGNYPAIRDDSYPARQLTLRAASTEGNSWAMVRLSDGASSDYHEGEDVETLFDSNLASVPMVYTVAGGQAVSIDQRPQLDIVSFGVSCAASDKMVEVSISGTDAASGNLCVVDAVTGSVTEVGEGSSVMVQPNDYGRYFLTTNSNTTAINGTELYDIVVSVRGKQVTVKSERPLLNVGILTIGGVVVSEKSHCGTEVSFTVNSGVYIVDAETDNGRKTVKLMVK